MQGARVNTDVDLPYDYEDFGMDAEELKEKYETEDNGEHPEFTIEQWRSGAASDSSWTRRGSSWAARSSRPPRGTMACTDWKAATSRSGPDVPQPNPKNQ